MRKKESGRNGESVHSGGEFGVGLWAPARPAMTRCAPVIVDDDQKCVHILGGSVLPTASLVEMNDLYPRLEMVCMVTCDR